MDFGFTEDQHAVGDLARGILEKELSPERLRAAERDEDCFDRPLWETLAEAVLIGLACPEAAGGMGYGVLEACSFLLEIGRTVAPVPALPAIVASLAIAHLGDEEQQARWLAPLAAGRTILSPALDDAGSSDPGVPATTARADDGGWVLSGCKRHVRAAHLSERLLVPAAVGEASAVFIVDPAAEGVCATRQRTSNGETITTVELDGVRVAGEDLLGKQAGGSREAARWLADHAIVAACAVQLGVAESALEITSNHVRERVQFGVPIGTFQAVQHRCADAYIGITTMRWCLWRAAWALSQARPALREAAIAKFWAAEAGSAVVNAAQHLHGGLGVDLDYPMHRYFLWSKGLELELGSAAQQLARLGRDMARTGPPAEAR